MKIQFYFLKKREKFMAWQPYYYSCILFEESNHSKKKSSKVSSNKHMADQALGNNININRGYDMMHSF